MMDINFGLEHEVVTNGGAMAMVSRQTFFCMLSYYLPVLARWRPLVAAESPGWSLHVVGG